MKNIVLATCMGLLISLLSCQIDAIVKVFVNDSNKNIGIKIYDNNNSITSIQLAPGAIQDVFLTAPALKKIVISDEQTKSDGLSSSMARYVLQHDVFAINDHMIFIIHKNKSVSMYQGSTSRDAVLEEIDAVYQEKQILPTLHMSIHTTKSNHPWIVQKVDYKTEYKNSFLKSIESLFA